VSRIPTLGDHGWWTTRSAPLVARLAKEQLESWEQLMKWAQARDWSESELRNALCFLETHGYVVCYHTEAGYKWLATSLCRKTQSKKGKTE
jgi:hypothetical protein